MEKFYITFHMNNGEKIEIEEERDPTFEFLITLEHTKKWLKAENKIINLDNVNSVTIETETGRQQELENMTVVYSNLDF